jgi:hypothetical protein
MTKIWNGKIEKGKLKLNDQESFRIFINNSKDRQIELILRSPKKIRSQQQNKYYWVCIVTPIANHLGYPVEEMHGILKYEFASKLDTNTTTDMSTIEFSEYYIKWIRDWALSEHELYLPEPNEVEYK